MHIDTPRSPQDDRSMDIFDDINSFEQEMLMDSFLETVSFDKLAHRSIDAKNIIGLLEAAGAFFILL